VPYRARDAAAKNNLWSRSRLIVHTALMTHTKFTCPLAAVLLLLAALPASAETLRIGMLGDPATLDPAQSTSVTDRVALAAVCDKLIELDAKLSYVPQLATGWSWSDDRLALTMTLRDGVVFHDGEPFDAEAVRFNFERNKTAPYSRRQSELKPVKTVTVLDPHTVRIELSEPYAPLLAQLADRAGMMVSPKAARTFGDRLATHPVCAGPYKFLEWVAQDRIVFERFAGYWNAGAVSIDTVTYLPIPDDTVRLANLRAGGLQIIERVSPSDVATVRADPRVKLYEAPSIGYRVLSINTNKGPAAKSPLGSNSALREAFELSLDRAIINQVAFDGLFIPSNQPEAPGTPFYAAALPTPPRDLDRARTLVGMARAPVKFLLSNDSLDQRVAQIIQAMASEAGFDVKLEVTESASLLGRLKSGDYELALLIWSGRPDPDANIAMWVACDGFINWGNYCDPRLDQILHQARSTTDVKERADLYAQAAAIYLAARPYLFLYHFKWLWGVSAKLDGFVPHADGIIRLQGLRFR
jgi:peptide/nickel transport system substrate-binding protein